jgi:hypothetical protein
MRTTEPIGSMQEAPFFDAKPRPFISGVRVTFAGFPTMSTFSALRFGAPGALLSQPTVRSFEATIARKTQVAVAVSAVKSSSKWVSSISMNRPW